MPFLDVTDVVLDPMLADRVTVNRRAESISNSGRASVTPQVFSNVVGVVTMASPNDLQRLPDDQRTGRNISFITKFKLRGTAPGFQPDTIVWLGDEFVVKVVEPYTRFGAGFVQAIAGSMNFQDAPP